MKVRKAVVGIDVSTECVVLILETRWTNGGRISAGNFRTSAPTLTDHEYLVKLSKSTCPKYLPSDCLILNFAILVIQGLYDPINDLGTAVVIAGEERLSTRVQKTVEIIQGHVTKVCICIIQPR